MTRAIAGRYITIQNPMIRFVRRIGFFIEISLTKLQNIAKEGKERETIAQSVKDVELVQQRKDATAEEMLRMEIRGMKTYFEIGI